MIYQYMSVTTMRLSKRTLRELENLKQKLGADTLEDVIQHLLKERRKRAIKYVFGKDADKISRFTEEDRGEDRR
jgi:predicted CopG family antitoxin